MPGPKEFLCEFLAILSYLVKYFVRQLNLDDEMLRVWGPKPLQFETAPGSDIAVIIEGISREILTSIRGRGVARDRVSKWQRTNRYRAPLAVLVLFTIIAFQNCGKKNSADTESGGGDPIAQASAGFPNWRVTDAFISLETTEQEAPLNEIQPLGDVVILADVTGNISYDVVNRVGLDTVLVRANSNGGFFVLTLLPDFRYRIFSMVQTSYLGTSRIGTVREVGTYSISAGTMTFKPLAASGTYSAGSGPAQTQTETLKVRTYEVSEAVVKEFTASASSAARTNSAYILRGPCPDYLVLNSCSSSDSTHELVLQMLDVVR